MNITINTRTPEQLSDIEEMLRGIAGGVERVQRLAVNDAMSHLRTMTARRIMEKFDISKKTIQHYMTEKVRVAESGKAYARLDVRGEKISLYNFRGTYPSRDQRLDYFVNVDIGGQSVRVRPSQQARGHQYKETQAEPLYKKVTGTGQYMKAFVATMPNGVTGIFARDGGRTGDSPAKDAITMLKGDAVAQMLEHKEVSGALTQDATEWYEKRLDHYVQAMLTGSLRKAGSGRGRRR